MLDWLKSFAEKIEQSESAKIRAAKKLRQEGSAGRLHGALEEKLVYPVSQQEISGKIAAVDGGIAGEELHGFDLLLMRSVGVVFEYGKSRIISHSYFPSSRPPIEYDMRSGLDSHEVIWHKSLFRLKGELGCAASLIEKHSPAALLLDGSIAPLLSDKPSEESEMRQLYQEVLHSYTRLYQTAWSRQCLLLGIIKDSRSKRFMELLSKSLDGEEGLRHTTDTSFLFFLLEAGERTCAFTYSSSPSSHQILKDLGGWSEKILSFYLKPVEEDRPLRVEFLAGQKAFGEVASLVHSLSCMHKAYAYPAALIEADLRAALREEEADGAYAKLFFRLGKRASLYRLRRNSRPFR
ncbi:MAG: DNA double-strand break repair nuclease NurA [Candidatus Micrarchaeota archaeon]|nr:DNA double-strand break repair nuclease NurA [Candidatus Micrarchaeota archaeon]